GNPTVYDITKFGAVGNGATNSFKAFLNTWIQVCNSPVPATLLVPKGDFLAGPVIFAGPCKSKVTVDVQGTVIATTSGYATPEWILFERVDNVLLTGTGTFHGKGEDVWKADGCGKKVQCNLPPTSLKFRNMKNVEISGISSVNAKAFHMFLVKTENVKIHNIKLVAPAESPNTDGIHLSNADHVSILDSTIATGDDCVSVGRGCNNVTVERVVCGPGHGLSIGSLGKYKHEEDVSGIHVNNCTMIETDNGLRIKTWGGSDPSKVVDVKFENIIMQSVKNPIIIDQNYGSRGGDSRVEITDVLFKNVRGTTITHDIVQIMCSKSVPCKGVNVVDVNLAYVGKPGGEKKSSAGGLVGAFCDNANVIFGGKLSFPMCPK
ncbi:PREDICTED: exopolygalacturonase clone GBGE184, partial [Camelina sativa]|uniref:Exopolygalacturonase clone GBGE184 n=1 Tax=Camelina sativa TaxID=90675 RepID=A0ABM0X447_CAMSA